MYDVILTPQFKKDVKFYLRKKKYTHIMQDIQPIVDDLIEGNFVGDEIAGLRLPDDEHSYKVRMANTDMKVGKSNGYRLIYYVIKDDTTVFLLTIYSKKDMEDIPDAQLLELISAYCQ